MRLSYVLAVSAQTHPRWLLLLQTLAGRIIQSSQRTLRQWGWCDEEVACPRVWEVDFLGILSKMSDFWERYVSKCLPTELNFTMYLIYFGAQDPFPPKTSETRLKKLSPTFIYIYVSAWRHFVSLLLTANMLLHRVHCSSFFISNRTAQQTTNTSPFREYPSRHVLAWL